MAASAIQNEPSPIAPPMVVNSCPMCSHWLPDGTLACPDCKALTYGKYLSELAFSAQQLEQSQRWAEARARWEQALGWLPSDTQQAASVAQHVAAIDARLKAEEETKAKWTRRLGPLAPVALFLMKAKSLLLLFKLKFLFSFLLYLGLYWALFGLPFATGFTFSILVHEMGHYIAAKRRGLKVDMPIFLPGFGAYVRWYGAGVPLVDIAGIALAGPLYGLTVALASFALLWATHMPIFLVLAHLGAFWNLFNLLPVVWFDGAHATFALSRLQRGMIAATCLLFFGLTASVGNTDSGLIGPNTQWMFLIVGAGMVWRCFTHDEPEKGDTRIFAYFQALVIVLGLVMSYTAPLMAQVHR
jgi:Zn-dependent protease